jgi:S1-C subfamily serine protease
VDSSDGGSFDEEAGGPEEGERGQNDELRADEHALKGWIPPEERAWRHPSETGTWTAKPPYLAGPVLRTSHSGRRATWATALVGAGAAAALVTGGLMLASHTQPMPVGTPTRVTSPPTAATRSIVRLEVDTASSSSYGCGVVVGPGGMIATNATLLVGSTRIMATTTSGRRERATVVAIDTASDIGIVKIETSLPIARVADWSDLEPGSDAVEMALSSGGNTSVWWNETIASTGDPVRSGPGTGMVSVVATAPAGASPNGAVLMEPDGTVVGLLDKSAEPANGSGLVFLPGEFVVQVAQELMADNGHIQHGWLGISGANTKKDEPRGALVTDVDPKGPADDKLRNGDVIEAIDGRGVRTMADLRSRLYLLAPGTRVNLRVERHHTVRVVKLSLSASP